MTEFKKYRRIRIAEIRPVNEDDIKAFKRFLLLPVNEAHTVSISDADLNAGSPKIGDVIARNPENHADQWLIAEDYFKANFEEI